MTEADDIHSLNSSTVNNDDYLVLTQEQTTTVKERKEKQVLKPSAIHASIRSKSDQHQQQEGRENVAKVSNTSTLASIVCVVAGTGALGIPHALSRSGWIGLVFLGLSAVMAQFSGCLLIRCLYHRQSHRLSGFPEIGHVTFGLPGRIVGIVFSMLLLLFTPILYMILAGDNVSRLLGSAGVVVSRKACTWIVSAVVGFPFALVRTMRDVSFMSFFASMATVGLLFVITSASVSTIHEQPNVHHDWANPGGIPIAFSTFSFSYCGNVIYPHLESSMAAPSDWPKVLLVATFAVTIMYMTVGFLAYLAYGADVHNPVYDSLPQGAAQNVAMLVATLHVLLAVPMYLYVLTVSIETWLGVSYLQEHQHAAATMKRYKEDQDVDVNATMDDHQEDHDDDDTTTTTMGHQLSWLKRQRLWLQRHARATRIVLRTVEICSCAVVAMLTPYFSDFMSLIGTIAAESLTFVLPCIFWIKLAWHDRNPWELLGCALIAAVGIFCAVFGTADAVKLFLNDIQQSSSL